MCVGQAGLCGLAREVMGKTGLCVLAREVTSKTVCLRFEEDFILVVDVP